MKTDKAKDRCQGKESFWVEPVHYRVLDMYHRDLGLGRAHSSKILCSTLLVHVLPFD